MFAGVSRSEASFKQVIGGVTVSYSGDGTAYHDPDDGTITISLTSNDGTLNVTVGPDALASWGSYVDIYILADSVALKGINIKGTVACRPYVCGNVGYVSKFSMVLGVVGNTNYYGVNYGLGMGSDYVPGTVTLKNSYTTAQLLGYLN
jgi:hypothetical protein